jgi:AcrR family transcriptional regulator
MAERVTRAEQQARTRRRLLDEGCRIFTERGFTAATVEEITAAVGVTRGALYKHFDGKEGLFLALAAELAEGQLDRWAAGEDAAATDEQHLEALGTVMDGDADLGLASVEFLAHVRSRPQFLDQALALQHDADARAASLLRRTCQALGIEPEVPVEDLVPLVSALANGLALRSTFEHDFDVDRLFRAGLVALLTGATSALPVPTTEELSHDRH